MSKKCMPLWREAHFEVKMYKTHQVWTTFGSWDVEKCTPLWREAHFEVKMYKTSHVWTTFGSWDVEKVHAVVARSTFRNQNVQNTTYLDHFWRFRCRFAWQAQGIVHLVKSEQNVKVCSMSKNDVGHLKRICKDAFSVAGAVQETCSSELLKRQVKWKNRKTHWYEAVSSALNFPFLKEVSQNCFIFDVANFETWGSLAELFCFWCCQVQKLRKSRRIASFLALSSSKVEEVSQNCCVFDVVKFKDWGSLAE